MTNRKQNNHNEPSVAPGMNTHDQLEEKANEQEVAKGDYTPVTRVFVDRTPDS
ncbi:MAG TPA: hypothetical protein VE710_03625 [Candidatus Bathyarchaeia archaeon]|nr:hypothetical protein [Candidatus Bathyarchaeia archaeon]